MSCTTHHYSQSYVSPWQHQKNLENTKLDLHAQSSHTLDHVIDFMVFTDSFGDLGKDAGECAHQQEHCTKRSSCSSERL